MSNPKKGQEGGGRIRLKAPRQIVLKKTVEGGSIKQNFSSGRTKSVVVEVRRKKKFVQAKNGSESLSASEKKIAQEAAEKAAAEEVVHAGGQEQVEHSAATEPVAPQEKPEEVKKAPAAVAKSLRKKEPSESHRNAGQSSGEKPDAAKKTPPEKKSEKTERSTPKKSAQKKPQSAAPRPAETEKSATKGKKTPEQDAKPVDTEKKPPQKASEEASEPVTEEKRSEPGKQSAAQKSKKRRAPAKEKAEKTATPEPKEAKKPSKKEPGSGKKKKEAAQKEAPAKREEKKAEESATPPAKDDKGEKGEESGEGSGRRRRRRKKLTASQRNELVRQKTEDLMAKRLSQIEQLREQKRLEEKRLKALEEEKTSKPKNKKAPKKRPGAQRSRPEQEEKRAGRPPRKGAEAAASENAAPSKKRRRGGENEAAAQPSGNEQQREAPSRSGRSRRKRRGGGNYNEDGPPQGRGGGQRSGRGGRFGNEGGGGGRRGRRRGTAEKKAEPMPPPAPIVRDVIVPDTITVGELASRMAVKASEVIKSLLKQGMMMTINQPLDQDTAVLIVEEMGHKAKLISEESRIQEELADQEDLEKDLSARSPVVTVMGHVDHGKTSLLDAIRKTDITSREHGGITQHIGAYQVKLSSGDRLTFLDTPGHAAFTAMRYRGAMVTDIVILVVAADDGVMPQTLEAINHAKEAGVTMMVAINKIDRPDANPDKIMQQLSEHDLIPESWGGEVIFVNVSAKTGDGIEELEEMILLQSEMMNLQANADKRARGVIIEAKLDRGRGAVATCLVRSGTLKVGDIFVVGDQWGRVRLLINDHGQQVKEAGPSTPVEVIGLSGVPEAGDELVVTEDERRAKGIALFRQNKSKEHELSRRVPTKLDDIFDQVQQGEVAELKVVLKGDVRGSIEAVADALQKITHDEIRVNVIHKAVGGINESDVMMAIASDAFVLGFNVRADAKARELSRREKVELRFYNVIYDLINDITMAMEGRLNPTYRETVLGNTVVREVFRIAKIGNVAGCLVTEGTVRREARARLLRDQVVIFDGDILALKRFKEDAKEVREGMECGISLERFNDIKAGDTMEVYIKEAVKQTIGG
ncbi:translation initiation factor IF-2 [Magnetococcales bacterium HHB-1]